MIFRAGVEFVAELVNLAGDSCRVIVEGYLRDEQHIFSADGIITVMKNLDDIIQTYAKIQIIGELTNFEYWRFDRKIYLR